MTRRSTIISQLSSYFALKGGVMSAEEYKEAEDAPIRFIVIKRTIGSWRRLINMIGDLSDYSAAETVTPVVVEEKTPPKEKEAEPKAPVKKPPTAKE